MNQSFFGLSAIQFLEKLSQNIIHIYGQVGKFQWCGGDRSNDDYGTIKINDAIRLAEGNWKDKIFVIGEKIDGEAEKNVKTAQLWLDKAEAIFFLGFGFDDTNNALLNLEKSAVKAQGIYCTNYGDSGIIREKIERLLRRKDGNKLFNTLQGRQDYFGPREGKISTKKVYEALSKDFNLLA
jgi:hypothetical protein